MTHKELVESLAKPGHEIVREMSSDDAFMLHMAVGICGEAGELLDAIKRKAIYQKPLDPVNVIEELGDLEFYMEGLRQVLEIHRGECLDANIRKLMKRYPAMKYTNVDATNRADKNGQ